MVALCSFLVEAVLVTRAARCRSDQLLLQAIAALCRSKPVILPQAVLAHWRFQLARPAVTVPAVWRLLLDLPLTARVVVFPSQRDLLVVRALFAWRLAKARVRVVPSLFRLAGAIPPLVVRSVLAAVAAKPRPAAMSRSQRAMLAPRVPAARSPS